MENQSFWGYIYSLDAFYMKHTLFVYIILCMEPYNFHMLFEKYYCERNIFVFRLRRKQMERNLSQNVAFFLFNVKALFYEKLDEKRFKKKVSM